MDIEVYLKLDDDDANKPHEPKHDLHAGTHLFEVKVDGTHDAPSKLTLHPSAFSKRLRFDNPKQGTQSLSGVITHEGKPVKDVTVTLWAGFASRFKIGETKTNQDGKYSFENVVNSTIGRGDDARHYVGVQTKHPTLVPGDGKNWRDITIPVKPGVMHTLDFQMVKGGFITGTLLDEQDKPRSKIPLRIYLAIPGAKRGNSYFMTYTDTDERVASSLIRFFPGEYIVEHNGDGYTQFAKVNVEAEKETKLPIKK